jgi:hypothetical protein
MADMTNKKQKPKKLLNVKRDVMRVLSQDDLKAVGGGLAIPTITTGR